MTDWLPGICDVILDGGDTYKGLKFFADRTAYGDGEYMGSNGFPYCVDAGLLGAIPLELVTDPNGLDLGTIIEVEHQLPVSCTEGVFTFGGITINTRLYEEDEDLSGAL
jgi:hypothetical protein